MHLMRLVYASKISPQFNSDSIQSIIDACAENNPQINVTGVLCFSNDYFIQCIEGSRICVNQLYHKILLDERHYDPSILQYVEIDKRSFNEWSMGYIPASVISGDLISQFSGERKFQPYSMSGESCFLLIKELVKLGLVDTKT